VQDSLPGHEQEEIFIWCTNRYKINWKLIQYYQQIIHLSGPEYAQFAYIALEKATRLVVAPMIYEILEPQLTYRRAILRCFYWMQAFLPGFIRYARVGFLVALPFGILWIMDKIEKRHLKKLKEEDPWIYFQKLKNPYALKR
jgi:hypothetical protein